jgi:hypothetical protein
MNYREATLKDSAGIALLHARSWQVHYRGILSDAYLAHEVTDDRLKVWESRLAHPAPNQYVLVAEDGVTLCGLACVYAGADPVWGYTSSRAEACTCCPVTRGGAWAPGCGPKPPGGPLDGLPRPPSTCWYTRRMRRPAGSTKAWAVRAKRRSWPITRAAAGPPSAATCGGPEGDVRF